MSKLTQYVKESYAELTNQVEWTPWSSLQKTTIAVLVATIIISLAILVMDLVAKNGTEALYF